MLYTTKVTMEIEVQSYQEPTITVLWLKDRLKCEAIQQMNVVGVESNYQLHKPPADKLSPVDGKFE